MKVEPKVVELHVAHGCNLRCEGCNHYSNHQHKGILPLETGREWMVAWCDRILPHRFSLMGGEPTLNPQLVEFVYLAHEMWPGSYRDVVTNGFFLERHPDLGKALKETGTNLAISIHYNSPEYLEHVAKVKEIVRPWGVPIDWRDSYRHWQLRYKGYGDSMMPYSDGDPRLSWETCHTRFCSQLHEGKLWKCPNIAYLGMQARKFKLRPEWEPYLSGYEPLSPDCTDEELAAFYDREDEFICGMCPANPVRVEKQDPTKPQQEIAMRQTSRRVVKLL